MAALHGSIFLIKNWIPMVYIATHHGSGTVKQAMDLTIAVDAPGKHVAMDYSRTAKDKLACTIAVAQNEMVPRFDSGTQRRRFIRDSTDVWAPVKFKCR